jgi:hypothetical protein
VLGPCPPKIHDVHVRTPSVLTEEALKRIGELYAIESEIRGKRARGTAGSPAPKALPLLASLEVAAWRNRKPSQGTQNWRRRSGMR